MENGNIQTIYQIQVGMIQLDIIKANSQTTKKLNLENTYGELEKGTYRVIKTVFFENGKKTDIYSTEFEIKQLARNYKLSSRWQE